MEGGRGGGDGGEATCVWRQYHLVAAAVGGARWWLWSRTSPPLHRVVLAGRQMAARLAAARVAPSGSRLALFCVSCCRNYSLALSRPLG